MVDLTQKRILAWKMLASRFIGTKKYGPFDIDEAQAAEMLSAPEQSKWATEFGCCEALDKWKRSSGAPTARRVDY